MDTFWKKRVGCQDRDNSVKEALQSMCHDSLDVRGHRVGADGTTDLGGTIFGVLIIISWFDNLFDPPPACALPDLSAVKSDKTHQWLRPEKHRFGMPEEREA